MLTLINSLFVIASFFFLLCIIIVIIIWKSKDNTLIPSGKIIYNDLLGEMDSLYSSTYPLAGKPDLIIKKGWKYIPVEIKTGNHRYPKKHHVMQVISYCQLIKETYTKTPSFGYLIYSDTKKRFKIPFTQLEIKQLELSLAQMKEMITQNQIRRNHNNKNRCNHCNMRGNCTYRVK
jgi:CRISPR-associated exonuclease Cas4